MSLDQSSESFQRFQALPLQRRLPLVEEPTSPSFRLVGPDPAERLLEEVRLVQAPIDPEQFVQGSPPLGVEVVPMGEQDVLRSLDVAALAPLHALVLGLAHLVDGLAQVLGEVEVIVVHHSVGAVGLQGCAVGTPHVHHAQFDADPFRVR